VKGINNVGLAFWLLAKYTNMAMIISMHTIAINLQEIQSKSTVSEIRVSLNIYLYHYKDHSLTGLGLQVALFAFNFSCKTHYTSQSSKINGFHF